MIGSRLAILAFVAALSTLLSTSTPATAQSGSAVTAPQVRTDGVYCTLQLKFSGNTATAAVESGVRFYEDHSAVEFQHSVTESDLSDFFTPERDDLLPGTWTMQGNELVVVISRGFEESTRTGTLTPEGWKFTEKVSYETGLELRDKNGFLTFQPVTFTDVPESKAKNRRPYFVGHGKMTRNLYYDRAGNLRSATQEMEVQATDPDGDPLQFVWTASNGTIKAHGRKAAWKMEVGYGQPVPGNFSVEVSDNKGGKVLLRSYTR